MKTMKADMKNITFRISVIEESTVPTSIQIVEIRMLSAKYMPNLSHTTAGFFMMLRDMRHMSAFTCHQKGVAACTRAGSLSDALRSISRMCCNSSRAPADSSHPFIRSSTAARSWKDVSTRSSIQSAEDVISGISRSRLLKCFTACRVSPMKHRRPELSSRKRSERRKRVSLGWWMVSTRVVPTWEAMDLSALTTFHAAAESSPLVGSSRNMMRGVATSSHPMDTRRFCPPDSPRRMAPPMMVSRCFSSPSMAMARSDRSLTTFMSVE
mmetsp:Transcript_36464/g.69946  ORF Transcript_36464/g.69946 Transcript_36464/m.69946 type:complete len:268 (-) Transcript_36464:483-1286(-)